jgi:RNA-directed DNA polymerase
MSEKDSTGGATSSKGKAARIRAEVGGVGSSKEGAPDLWFGQNASERSDATCSAGAKRREGSGDGSAAAGLTAPDKVRQLQITLYRKAKSKPEYRFTEHSALTENREP